MENFTTVDQLSTGVAAVTTNYSDTMPSNSPVTLSNSSTWVSNTSDTNFDLNITTMDTNVTTMKDSYGSSTWEYDQATFSENVSTTEIGTAWYTTDETFLSTDQVRTLSFYTTTTTCTKTELLLQPNTLQSATVTVRTVGLNFLKVSLSFGLGG